MKFHNISVFEPQIHLIGYLLFNLKPKRWLILMQLFNILFDNMKYFTCFSTTYQNLIPSFILLLYVTTIFDQISF